MIENAKQHTEQSKDSPSPIETALRDPVSNNTRQKRRKLLIISGMGVGIKKTGLIPTEISSLGINLSSSNQETFQIFLAFIVVYFLIGFLIYGFSDFIAWRIACNNASKISYLNFFNRLWNREFRNEEYQIADSWVSNWPIYFVFPISVIRAVFDFIFPIFIGCYGIYLLFT